MKKSVLFLFGIAIFSSWGCQPDKKTTSANLLSLVPPKTAVIVKTANFSKLVDRLEKNTLIQANPELPLIKYLEKVHQPLEKIDIADKSLWCFTKVGRGDVGATLS